MNKALHVFVYFFLILAAAGLFFEFQLNEKRSLLTDRNRLQEDYLVKIAATIEEKEPNKDATAEIKKDVSPVEAKIVDTPATENLLEEYKSYLEQDNLETFAWERQDIREQLREVYVLDGEGKPMMDGDRPQVTHSPEWVLLEKLLTASQKQQANLNTTRAELKSLHQKLRETVDELNALKPIARQDKVTIVEKNESIAKLEAQKADLENQIVKIKAQIDELNTEITSLKDEVVTAHDEAEAAKEELAKSQKLVDQLKKLLQEALVNSQGGVKTGAGVAVSTLPAGDKGKIIEADNENMFAIVEFSDKAMEELRGKDGKSPLPLMEFGVKRTGFKGEAGEFVGRVRLRQAVPGKNYIICDILSSWEQDKLQPNDIIFAD